MPKQYAQSIIFKKSQWTQDTATRWLTAHKYKNNGVDITRNYYRYRQIAPIPDHRYRTISLGDTGIKIVIGRP